MIISVYLHAVSNSKTLVVNKERLVGAVESNPRPKLGKLVVDEQKRTNWRQFDIFRSSQMDSNWSSRRQPFG